MSCRAKKHTLAAAIALATASALPVVAQDSAPIQRHASLEHVEVTGEQNNG